MSIQTVAHINFRGDARPALSFYQSVFGGDLVLPRSCAWSGLSRLPRPCRSGW